MRKLLVMTCITCVCCTCVPYIKLLGKVPEVSAVSPSGRITTDETVTVDFTCDMDKSTVEDAWSFMEGSVPIDGSFHWESSQRVRFTPQQIVPPQDYTLYIGYSAGSEEGVRLESAYTHTFHTTKDVGPFCVEEINPSPEDIIISPHVIFEVLFNKSVEKASFYNAFTITPTVQGRFEWTQENTRVRFTPLTPLAPMVHYQLKLSTRCCDQEGRHLLEGLQRNYKVRRESQVRVIKFCRITPTEKSPFEITPGSTYHLPQDTDISITFSEKITTDLIPEVLSLQPSPDFDIEWSQDKHTAILFLSDMHADQRPGPGKKIKLLLAGSEYFLQWDGEGMQQILLCGVSYCNDTTAVDAEFARIQLNDLINFPSSDNAAIEMAFDHDPEAHISEIDLMQALQLYCTHNAAGIRLSSLEHTDSLECAALADLHPDSKFRLSFSIDRHSLAGLLCLSIAKDLHDSLGNSLRDNVRLSYNL